MEFLAPAMLLGVLGLGIPVAIHLIGRRRARVVKFAALDYLLATNRKVARRLQLRELILLIVRVLVCLAIPLALAKPYTSCATDGPMVERGPQATVLIIDNSFASRLRAGDDTLLGRAKARAYDVLGQLGPEADVAILLASEGANSPSELSRDHLRLRDNIADIEPDARPADSTTALRRAAQLLAASSHDRKTIYLISPLAASGFRVDDPPWPPGTGPRVMYVSVTGDVDTDNVAVVDLEVEPDPSSGSRGVRVTAELANFGSRPVDSRGIGLTIAGREVARGMVSLRPGERQKKRFLATLPTNSRNADVVVALDRDDLAIDDRRFVRAELREEVRVLLVNGDPHTDRHDSETFYLEAALRPGDRSDSGVTVEAITDSDLEAQDLGRFDVIFLANVRALAPDLVAGLSAWVEGGGGLFVSMGDNVDADAYNRTMKPLLPQALNTALDLGYGARASERAGRDQRLVKFEADHPIFQVFSRDAPGLRDASFHKLMLLGPTAKVDDRAVLARYENGAAAVVTARKRKGRLLLFTSSIDRDWNDLPIYPGYLPLVQQSVRYLARKQTRLARASVVVGRSALLPVAGDDARLEVRGPSGDRTVFEGEGLDGRKRVRFSDTDEPGIYRVLATDDNGRLLPREEAHFAVNLDPRGSDLRPAPDSILPRSGDGIGGDSGRGSQRRRVELWHALAAGLLLLLLTESILVSR